MSSPASTDVADHRASAADGRRADIAKALAEAADLPGVDAEAVTWLRRKITERSFNLVIAGQFKRGKSSVINALIGELLLPVGVIPLTSVVTVIRAGTAARLRIESLDGTSHDVPLEELPDYVTERGNPKNTRHVRQVIVEHPSGWLANGLQLIDTPGIGSVYEHNSDVTRDFLPQADAVLFIASVEQPLSQSEIDFLTSIRQYAGRIFCLLNKIDHLRRDELQESVRFSEETIRSALGADVPVFPVSARLALEGKLHHKATAAESGFADFEHALRRFIGDESANVWIRSVARSLLRILSHLRFQLGLEARVLRTPLQEISDKLAAFGRKKQELERALLDYQVLMDAGARALMREAVEPELERFKRSEQERIVVLVEKWCAESAGLSSRELDVSLEHKTIKEIRSAYDEWLALENQKASEAFDSLCGRFWGEMQAAVDELMRFSSELFGVTFEPVVADSRWTPESGFYYRFWYEPTGLATLSSALVTMLPALLSVRLVLRRRRNVAVELVEMQAGRIRYDFEQRVLKSAQDARQRMTERIESALAGLDAAIANGIEAQRRGEAEVSAALSRSSAVEQTVDQIEARVKAYG